MTTDYTFVTFIYVYLNSTWYRQKLKLQKLFISKYYLKNIFVILYIKCNIYIVVAVGLVFI